MCGLGFDRFSRTRKTGFGLRSDGEKPLLPEVVGSNDLRWIGKRNGYEIAESFDDSLLHPSGWKLVTKARKIVGKKGKRGRPQEKRFSI